MPTPNKPQLLSVPKEAQDEGAPGSQLPWQVSIAGGCSSPSSGAENYAWQGQRSLHARFILFLFKEILQIPPSPFILAQCMDLGSEFIY